MDGVTVLNIIKCHGISSWWYAIPLIFLILFIVFDMFEFKSGKFIFFVCAIISLLILAHKDITVPNGKYRYEVVIDKGKEVSLTEFQKHYKIVEQRGQIYVVEEKESE